MPSLRRHKITHPFAQHVGHAKHSPYSHSFAAILATLLSPLRQTRQFLTVSVCCYQENTNSLNRDIPCLSRQCSTHTHHGQMCCHTTDYVHVNGHDRTITVILAKHCIKLPDDGSLVIRNMLEQF